MNFTNNTENISLIVGDKFAFLPSFSLHCCSKVRHKIEMNSLLLPFSWGFFDSDRHEKSEKSFPQELFFRRKKSRETIVKWNKKAVDNNTFLYLAYFICTPVRTS